MPRLDPFISALREWIELFSHRSMRSYIYYLRGKGLSMSVMGTLHHLKTEGRQGVSDLGEHLGISSAAVSQMLDKLVEEGFIVRVEDPEDRRMKRITLTEAGNRILDESVSARLSWVKDFEGNFSEKEKEQITAAVRLMIDRARADRHCG